MDLMGEFEMADVSALLKTLRETDLPLAFTNAIAALVLHKYQGNMDNTWYKVGQLVDIRLSDEPDPAKAWAMVIAAAVGSGMQQSISAGGLDIANLVCETVWGWVSNDGCPSVPSELDEEAVNLAETIARLRGFDMGTAAQVLTVMSTDRTVFGEKTRLRAEQLLKG